MEWDQLEGLYFIRLFNSFMPFHINPVDMMVWFDD